MITRNIRLHTCLSCRHQILLQRRHSSIVAQLQDRGLVKTVTSPNLRARIEQESIGLYCGVDPTAPSLHVGNLLTLIPVLHFYLYGHHATALVGGATGLIGDPAGKTKEREAIAGKTIASNVSFLTAQLDRFFVHGRAYATARGYDASRYGEVKVVNNAVWYADLGFMHFMQQVGRNVRLSSMLARDSVKNRLSAEEGMSFGEFTYQLLQAYDFWHLHKEHNVSLQIGGSDQYGNITAGIDLISRLQLADGDPAAKEVFGLTVPLLTTASGEKFGKSAGNAIWLDATMTSPFDLYQYFLKTLDADLASYLQRFTLLPMQKIETLVREHQQDPKKRLAARVLAAEVVELVHGREALGRVQIANRILFPQEYPDAKPLAAETIKQVFADDSALVMMPRQAVVGSKVSSLLRDTGTVKSAREAHELIKAGAVRCGRHKPVDTAALVESSWLLDDSILILKVGKNKFTFIQATD